MGFQTTDRRLLACGLLALLAEALGGAPGASAQFASSRSYPARGARGEITAWEQAERTRGAFETLTEAARTKAGYTRVLDSFRAIYHEHPQDLHAAEAVNAVAELLTEEGRGEHDAGLLRAAVKQYEFLRTQYPGSSLRAGALLAEAQIDQNDLKDRNAARERYATFLESYPRSSVAEEARAGLLSLDAGSSPRLQVANEPGTDRQAVATSQGQAGGGGAETARRNATTSAAQSAPPSEEAGVAPARRDQAIDASRAGAGAAAGNGRANGVTLDGAAAGAPVVRSVARPVGKLALVTGIRHWSTPSYTRVAIDLGDAVEYEAARVPSPDRIYFDLHGARLAPELVGKSFAVTDDGFLKKIRVAQSGGDFARIVLDVNDVTEYSAFLLPNPYRLIIDIHGRSKPAAAEVASVDAAARPTATVPNTRAMAAGSSTDVTRLSEQPGRVEATTVPTSQPIAAVVAGRGAGSGSSGAGLPATPPTGVSDLSRGAGGGSIAPLAPRASGSASAPPASAGALTSTGVVAPGGESSPSSLAGRRTKKSRSTTSDAKVVGYPGVPARAAVKTAEGETSLVRALGLKINRIVIDAGHGGHDSGTIGVDGLEEKDVVLDVALRLGKLLHDRLGAEVIYTRSDDTFVPLETRTAIANKAQADLFLSIHANSSPEPSARGVETYYLNFTAQPDALEVAARENAVSGQSIYQLSDLVKKITLKDKIAESREFATDVEQGLYGGLARGNDGLKDRGVKKAPFVVLIGANMPSILAEISFVTNPRDAGELRQPEYRERVAESLFKGVSRYAGGLSGTGPAMVARASGQ